MRLICERDLVEGNMYLFYGEIIPMYSNQHIKHVKFFIYDGCILLNGLSIYDLDHDENLMAIADQV